jgi:hypothetical protein
MSNKKKVSARPKAAGTTYKFAEFRAEAEAMATGEDAAPPWPPFVIDDVTPPIVITAPDTLERQLQIAELIQTGDIEAGQVLPLLRALCGEAFPRVWSLIKNDKDSRTAVALVQTLAAHMYGAIEGEAGDVPGGSQGSSD